MPLANTNGFTPATDPTAGSLSGRDSAPPPDNRGAAAPYNPFGGSLTPPVTPSAAAPSTFNSFPSQPTANTLSGGSLANPNPPASTFTSPQSGGGAFNPSAYASLYSGASTPLSGGTGAATGGAAPPPPPSVSSAPFGNFGSTPNSSDPTGGQTYNPLSNPLLTPQTSTTDINGTNVTQNTSPTVTLNAAQQFAQTLGGQVVRANTPWSTAAPTYAIQLPNGQQIDATAIAGILGNNAAYPSAAIKSGEIAKLMGVAYTPAMANLATSMGGGANAALSPIQSGFGVMAPPVLTAADGSGAAVSPASSGGMMTPYVPGVSGAPAGNAAGSVDNSGNGLAQLAAFFSLLSGGGNNVQSAMQGQQGTDLSGLIPLLMLLAGGGQAQPLYSRSQYPRFP